jgi:hypothetical protein
MGTSGSGAPEHPVGDEVGGIFELAFELGDAVGT